MKLSEMRKLSGLSQAELAVLSGVNLRSLQDYEQGHKSLSSAKAETLFRLSQVLDFSIEDILAESFIDVELALSDDKQMSQRIMLYEKCINDRKHQLVHFPVIEADEYVDMSRIYPTKQAAVKRVISTLREDKRVTSLRLFGSSITMACNKDSDIDFAVGIQDLSSTSRNEISEKIQSACDWGADIIWLDHLAPTERIYSTIMKGMVLL